MTTKAAISFLTPSKNPIQPEAVANGGADNDEQVFAGDDDNDDNGDIFPIADEDVLASSDEDADDNEADDDGDNGPH